MVIFASFKCQIIAFAESNRTQLTTHYSLGTVIIQRWETLQIHHEISSALHFARTPYLYIRAETPSVRRGRTLGFGLVTLRSKKERALPIERGVCYQ